MTAERRFKVNLKLEGKPCRWCQDALQLATEAAVCTGCEAEHHARCWDDQGGCSTAGCAHAPLKRFDAPVPGQPAAAIPQGPPPLPPGWMRCLHCRNAIAAYELVCPYCRGVTSPDGLYHGPKRNAPGAVASLVMGIVGLLLFGFILGPLAIVFGAKARATAASHPIYTGRGMATAGLILGILDLVAFAGIMYVTKGSN